MARLIQSIECKTLEKSECLGLGISKRSVLPEGLYSYEGKRSDSSKGKDSDSGSPDNKP